MTLIRSRKQLLIGLAALVSVLAGNAWVGFLQTQRLFRNSERVAHTHEVLSVLERVMASMTDAETGQRGFIITRDEKYLAQSEAARGGFPQTLQSLRELTRDNPRQQQRIVRLEGLCAERFAILAEGIQFEKAGRHEEAREVIVSGRGNSAMLKSRSVIQEMEEEERELLAIRDRENSLAYESALFSSFVGLLMGLAAVGAFVWLLQRFVSEMANSSTLMKRQEAELMKQSAALQEADLRKNEFLAILAHELRNPLSPISNALQVWKFVENDPQQMHQLHQMMQRQVQQMTRLIDDLLDVSRITRGKIELKKEPVPLANAITAAVEAARPLLDSFEHELAVDIGDDPLVVEGDSARLTQIFGNILQNAAKFTARHGKIEISARRAGAQAVVAIKDNGPGIPAPMLLPIFELFRQVDQTLERTHGGLGIGLALVKRLVDLHGGHVEARSDGAGKGSLFVVTLPLLESRPTAPASGETAASNAGRETLPAFKMLVVDDVQASAKTLALMLRAIGQQPHVIHDGAAAVAWILEHRPQYVFLDIAMPGMSGYDVARQIRGRDELRGVYLIALTGYGQDEDRRRALEAGFDQHLTKPTSIDQLQQLLTGNPRRAQTDRAPAAPLGLQD